MTLDEMRQVKDALESSGTNIERTMRLPRRIVNQIIATVLLSSAKNARKSATKPDVVLSWETYAAMASMALIGVEAVEKELKKSQAQTEQQTQEGSSDTRD